MNNRLPTVGDILDADEKLPASLVYNTPLIRHDRLSELYDADIFYKNEGAQPVRSYKIRGAGNAIRMTTDEQRERGMVCASAGNHSQGFSRSCREFDVHGTVFMPRPTSLQKIEATKRFGNNHVEVRLEGDDFDQAYASALEFQRETNAVFIHPFNHPDTIAGQGTVAVQILRQLQESGRKLDEILIPIGGGGLAAGMSEYLRSHSPQSNIIGVEPEQAAAMHASLEAGHLIKLDDKHFSDFVDGAAIRTPGNLTFEMIQRNRVDVRTVDQNRLCKTMLELYNIDGIITEPAGALAFDALRDCGNSIRGKVVVCVLSGTNFDMNRASKVIERAERYEGRHQYFIISLPNRPGALEEVTSHIKARGINIAYIHFDEAQEKPELLLKVRSADSLAIEQCIDDLRDTHFHIKNVTNQNRLERIFK